MKNAYLRIERLVQAAVEGHAEHERIPLGIDSVLIARPSMDPDTVVPDIKIVGDDYVSRTPAEISYDFGQDCFSMRDHGSTNGVFLNGERLAKGAPYRLQDNDLIGLAMVQGEIRVLLRFRESDATVPDEIGQEPWKPPTDEGLSVNLAARRVFVDGREIPLTKTEWKVFETLYTNQGKVCLMNYLSMMGWGDEAASSELIIRHIKNIRDKIEPDPSNPGYILTRPGGYLLEP